MTYLLYLAWATWHDTGALGVDEDSRPTSWRRVVYSDITLNLLNPRLTTSFLAFLPLFVPAGQPGSLGPMLALSGVFVATFVVFGGCGLAAAALRDKMLSRPRLVDGVRKVYAATFAALAGRLAVETR